jgi:hypothetical protein
MTMTNRYDEEYAAGYMEAIDAGERASNPHPYHSVEWYAWDAGYHRGHRQVNPQPSEVDLELEASLAAYGDAVAR